MPARPGLWTRAAMKRKVAGCRLNKRRAKEQQKPTSRVLSTWPRVVQSRVQRSETHPHSDTAHCSRLCFPLCLAGTRKQERSPRASRAAIGTPIGGAAAPTREIRQRPHAWIVLVSRLQPWIYRKSACSLRCSVVTTGFRARASTSTRAAPQSIFEAARR